MDALGLEYEPGFVPLSTFICCNLEGEIRRFICSKTGSLHRYNR